MAYELFGLINTTKWLVIIYSSVSFHPIKYIYDIVVSILHKLIEQLRGMYMEIRYITCDALPYSVTNITFRIIPPIPIACHFPNSVYVLSPWRLYVLRPRMQGRRGWRREDRRVIRTPWYRGLPPALPLPHILVQILLRDRLSYIYRINWWSKLPCSHRATSLPGSACN